ncbi:MAG: HlyD family efflux transporter periplasmic adaptor subunit [Deltaproteobacteria bacterium]|nr:HlyD family efflux transporter periplasmic adaptor subunit [Deltaproteobacteria bacterium]
MDNLEKRKKKKLGFKALFWFLFILSLAGLIYWAFSPRPILVEITKVTQEKYQQTLKEEGKTRVREVYQVTSPVNGNLHRIELHPGDTVQAGDFIATVDWPSPRKIQSPVSGKILRIHRESEGPIQRGETILEIANPSALEVVAEVLTENAVQIPAEASVKIEDWGGCDVLTGRVRLVEPAAFTKISALGIEEQRVNVIVDITSPPEKCVRLADAYRVYCEIILFESEQALTIPTGALFRDAKQWAVFQVVDGHAKKTNVEISRRNSEKAMIESGLTLGDQVIVYPSDKVKDGSLVKSMF